MDEKIENAKKLLENNGYKVKETVKSKISKFEKGDIVRIETDTDIPYDRKLDNVTLTCTVMDDKEMILVDEGPVKYKVKEKELVDINGNKRHNITDVKIVNKPENPEEKIQETEEYLEWAEEHDN